MIFNKLRVDMIQIDSGRKVECPRGGRIVAWMRERMRKVSRSVAGILELREEVSEFVVDGLSV